MSCKQRTANSELGWNVSEMDFRNVARKVLSTGVIRYRGARESWKYRDA